MTMLLALIFAFAQLSLFAIGGASAALPAMERIIVHREHWMSAQEFVRLYALAQAAPGPNVLAVTVFGWEVAGIAGALAATLAFLLPAVILAYIVGGIWARFRERRWRILVQAGIVPVTIGLMIAAAFILLTSAVETWREGVIAVVVALGCLFTRRHPLWFLAASALAGLAGFS